MTQSSEAVHHENSVVCWQYDHAKGRVVKGINLLSGLYHANGVSVPVAVEVVSKTVSSIDQTEHLRRTSALSKNEYLRGMLWQCRHNGLAVRYVLADSWFASAESMRSIKQQLRLDFIMPFESNRIVATNRASKKQGEYTAIESLKLGSTPRRESTSLR